MEITTKPYGIVNINDEDIITFENGLVGFEDKKKFVLLGNPEEMLVWLQSLEDEKLAFVVIQPRSFRADYDPVIAEEELESLKVEDKKEVLLYSIVVVPEEIVNMTANLKAPICINVKNNMAKQIVLNDERYRIKELVLAQK